MEDLTDELEEEEHQQKKKKKMEKENVVSPKN
jgi:hypothetical protein